MSVFFEAEVEGRHVVARTLNEMTVRLRILGYDSGMRDGLWRCWPQYGDAPARAIGRGVR